MSEVTYPRSHSKWNFWALVCDSTLFCLGTLEEFPNNFSAAILPKFYEILRIT